MKRLFDNSSFNCFWYKLNLNIATDHYKPWLKDPMNTEMNNKHITISKITVIKYDNIFFN